MKGLKRHRLIWRVLHVLAGGILKRKFNYRPEIFRASHPFLLISNHVTNLDPLFVAMSFPDNHMYFVASEHIFRLGWISKLLRFLLAPIPRSKAAGGADTVMTCLRRLRAGASVALFAEGDTTWDGRTGKMHPATAKLIKKCKVAVVTYRLEGGYLTWPRWGRGPRKGKMRGAVVNVYTPEQIGAMSTDEIERAVSLDIAENAWERQAREAAEYRGKNRAENLEAALFLCPSCLEVGRLKSRGNELRCECGLRTEFGTDGRFDSGVPFPTVAEWDQWQISKLLDLPTDREFAKSETVLREILSEHRVVTLKKGFLRRTPTGFAVDEREFPFAEITDMSMVQTKRLLFSFARRYFEIKADEPGCLRKFYLLWRASRNSAPAAR